MHVMTDNWCVLEHSQADHSDRQFFYAADTHQNRLFSHCVLSDIIFSWHICESVVCLCICQPWWSHALCGRCLLHCGPCELCSGCLPSLITLVSLDTTDSAALSSRKVPSNSPTSVKPSLCKDPLFLYVHLSLTFLSHPYPLLTLSLSQSLPL